jgi:transcription elongation factor Elf1
VIRAKVIKPKKSIAEQAMDSQQEITCPACNERIRIKLKVLLEKMFTCPSCKATISVRSQ